MLNTVFFLLFIGKVPISVTLPSLNNVPNDNRSVIILTQCTSRKLEIKMFALLFTANNVNCVWQHRVNESHAVKLSSYSILVINAPDVFDTFDKC